LNRKQFAILAVAIASGAAALFVPRAAHGAPAAATSSRNFGISIVNGGGSCASEFCYSPASMTIRQADTVKWTNNSTAAHTVTRCTAAACSGVGPGNGKDPSFNSGLVNPGATFTLQFHAAGNYHYYCQIHGFPIMHGTIIVEPFIVKTTSLPGGTVGAAYSDTVKAAGGETPLVWSVMTGKLPTGLKLSSSGLISGKPTTTGTFTFTVKVSDSSSPALTATKALSITVS
jgi:plastocyanin